MSQFHPDFSVDHAILALADALCSWERATSRQSLLLVVPTAPDEEALMFFNGKPTPNHSFSDMLFALANYIASRPGSARARPAILEAARKCLEAEV